ncbi:hypothetical protein LTS18_009031, partial [Coniosporium uncinatum]
MGAPSVPPRGVGKPSTLAAPLLARLCFFVLLQAGHIAGSPIGIWKEKDEDSPKDPKDASLWAYLGVAVALVLLGGAFAGLTIALMGQDEVYLQVIATSGEGKERKHAAKVLNLLKKGKHWVLVTLLLSNVITNETLPIVLDRSLGGGWPAVLSSTVLIVIFGEIVPQSICVRFGLPIGAWMSPAVLALMWIMSPVAWPTAKLLDYLLGEDHGTTYKKAGLKTLVTLHRTLGTSPDERLNKDEVTIISAVLDLKEKTVGSIMTPMNDVFTLSADAVLDEAMMDNILSAGYSRIPIYEPDNIHNFVGMLLVKMLITYDPEDAVRVRDFSLATLPETGPDTSCLDIVNFFQEGKSHMVLVSNHPGEAYGAMGVVTLEDVIEELIGEEIVDESDVFVDVHKAIRRMAPAPRTKVPKGAVVTEPEPGTDTHQEGEMARNASRPRSHREPSEQPSSRRPSGGEGPTFLMRRKSSQGDPIAMRGNTPEMREHLKKLGPSNVASRPKQTRINTVKIKPGVATVPEGAPISQKDLKRADQLAPNVRPTSRPPSIHEPASEHQGGVGEGLLSNAGKEASDGIQALQRGYGTMSGSRSQHSWSPEAERGRSETANGGADDTKTKDNMNGTNGYFDQSPKSQQNQFPDKIVVDVPPSDGEVSEAESGSTIGDLEPVDSNKKGFYKKRQAARSGSITENIIDVGGVKKVVLEPGSSSDGDEQDSGEG